MNENKKAHGVIGLITALILALALSFGVGFAVDGKIHANDEQRIKSLIDGAVEGNAGYEDVSLDYGVEDGSLYLVKSGTGGEDSYVVIATAKSRGCTAETLCTFTLDGLISSVQLVKTEGGIHNAKELIEESGMLSAFGGIYCNSELVEIKKAEGAGACNDALILSVNKSCKIIDEIVAEEEVSE